MPILVLIKNFLRTTRISSFKYVFIVFFEKIRCLNIQFFLKNEELKQLFYPSPTLPILNPYPRKKNTFKKLFKLRKAKLKVVWSSTIHYTAYLSKEI